MKYEFEIEDRVLHLLQPAGTSRGVYRERRSWFVTLTDAAGHSGIGECAPLPDLSCDDIPEYGKVLSGFAEKLCREGEMPLEELRQYPSMLFGLETAMLSLKRGGSRLSDTPFADGKEGIPINGLVWMGTFDEMLPRLEEKLKCGFRCVKVKIGAIDFGDELRLLRLIRSRFSKEYVELRVDANGAFKPDEALMRMEQLSHFDIHSIEQPIRQGNRDTLARLCRETPLPIALDEELIGVNGGDEKKGLLEQVKPQYVVLKPSLHGGMAGTREWVETSAALGIGSWITSALESNVGLNAIAHLCASLYGSHITIPQGLGTGRLFADNIPMPLEVVGDELWYRGDESQIII
ncbi:MAG: o-succinylbenzoate synthase [Prevotella sp.]|uniref:o-succinylbenzoate synthase n=1 Tax=Prevotella sp. TaxID=59823 RepID=UPI002A329F9B|nr:o-succinylbenzoate synthase [Prevotella sp.]MDD7318312.1 o-succinylbenzoate synthase [Prevotellaceae bacterium]MDY4019684.1 o-succinylbenzoate synthase [Prevotella sp.]